MMFKLQMKRFHVSIILLLLLIFSCQKQNPISLPTQGSTIDLISPTVKITFPKNDSTYHTNDTLNIHVEVDDNNETNYPNIIISRLYGDNNTIEASYGAAFPSKHFSAYMGWLVVAPVSQKDAILIKASSTDNAGNIGKDSVIIYISN